jgi:hypothetical protein
LLDELKEEPAHVGMLSSTSAAFLNYAFNEKLRQESVGMLDFILFDRMRQVRAPTSFTTTTATAFGAQQE